MVGWVDTKTAYKASVGHADWQPKSPHGSRVDTVKLGCPAGEVVTLVSSHLHPAGNPC